jgi:hypothetical protein
MKSESPDTMSKALVRTATRSGLKGIASDALEITLDQVVKEGVLRDIPVVNTLANIVKAGVSVSEELFFRKLSRFLSELEKVPIEERELLLRRYPDGSKAQEELGESLLLLLERLDQIDKPTILARFFLAFVREEIEYKMFSRLAQALARFNLELIRNLRWRYQPEGDPPEFSEEIDHELALAGLLTASLAGSGAIGGSANYVNNSVGRLFVSIGLQADANEPAT